jgi:hypothetical protein
MKKLGEDEEEKREWRVRRKVIGNETKDRNGTGE